MSVKYETGIRLLIITPTLECGGSEKFVSMVCGHINTNLFTVCLVVVNNANPFYKISNPAIEVIYLQKRRVLFSLGAIKKAIRHFKPDIVFSTANHLNLYLAFFKNSFDKQIRFIAREASIVSINSRQAKMPVLYNRLIKKYYRRFQLIICQSAYMQQDLAKHYHIDISQTRVIHNGIENNLQTAAPPYQHDKPVYKFLTVARLSDEKGIERLIHAAGLLSVPFTYHIIGGGTKKAALQKLIDELQLQDKIFLAGQKDHPFAGMEDADLFLMGSYYEGFPNVLLEAGSYGMPAIAFDVPGGIAEVITENKNGFLVEDNDIISFAATINKALARNFDRNQIIETTRERFSLNKMMAALQTTFLEIARDK